MKITFDRSFYLLKNAVEIKDADCSAVAYLAPLGDKWQAKAFSGKRAKPDWYYSFKTEAQARERIAQHAEGVRQTEAARRERAAQRTAEKCHTVLDVWNKARTGHYLSAAETAICLRAALAAAFPGVKFAVVSDNYSMGCSVRVSWTDGPAGKAVNDLAQNYSFAGFDGMIDLKYSKDRWLAQDGTMSLAHTTGTEGSRGGHSESIGSPHRADCVLVRGGADYVTVSRERSFAAHLAEARQFAAKYRLAIPADFADHSELHRLGEYVAHLMYQEEQRGEAQGVA